MRISASCWWNEHNCKSTFLMKYLLYNYLPTPSTRQPQYCAHQNVSKSHIMQSSLQLQCGYPICKRSSCLAHAQLCASDRTQARVRHRPFCLLCLFSCPSTKDNNLVFHVSLNSEADLQDLAVVGTLRKSTNNPTNKQTCLVSDRPKLRMYSSYSRTGGRSNIS